MGGCPTTAGNPVGGCPTTVQPPLEQWQSLAGLGNSPRSILEELARIQSTDVVLPLSEDSQREIRLRCVVRPDKAQAALLDRLGLILPERLQPPAPMREM